MAEAYGIMCISYGKLKVEIQGIPINYLFVINLYFACMRRSYRQRLALWKSLMLHPGMDEYLLTLPDASRVVLHMHFEEGMPLHEIAAHLQVSLYITRHHHDYGLYLMKKNCKPGE